MENQLTYEQAINYISSLKKSNGQPDLTRLKKLLDLIGNPQDKIEFIHIAGTNGKGSTATFCSNIFKEAGYTVGTFTSPHIINFRERFQVNNQMITELELAWIVSTIRPFVEKLNEDNIEITEFEFITAVSFAFFIYKKCDIVCLETGLGGKFDATNIIKSPIACVITSISIDHTEELGNTIEQIAEEKCGIIKDNTTVICYPELSDKVFEIIKSNCENYNNVTLIRPSVNTIKLKNIALDETLFEYIKKEYSIGLTGKHQVYNAVTAIETIKAINGTKLKNINNLPMPKKINIKNDNIEKGLFNTKIPGRFEVISQNPRIILDGAHNEGGIQSLCDTINLMEGKKTIIIGMLNNKNCQKIIEIVSKYADYFICVDIESNKNCIDKSDMKTYFEQQQKDCSIANDYEEAINMAKNNCQSIKDTIIICGSLYLVSDIRDFLWDIL